MRTTTTKKDSMPVDQIDGAAVNLPDEKEREDSSNNDDTFELDEDILMYMINI